MLNDSWREIRARFYSFFLFFSFLANEFFLEDFVIGVSLCFSSFFPRDT